MKKALLISGGVLLLLLIAAFWYYLFVFGTPSEGEGVFARFGGEGAERVEQPTEMEPVVNVPVVQDSSQLKRLTTRPVAGMTFVSDSVVRFVEKGTGHVFEVTLPAGMETQVSNTTFARTSDARFSPDGSTVLLTYHQEGDERVLVGTISGNTLSGTHLVRGAHEVGFDTDGSTAFYLLSSNTGTEAHAYDLIQKSDKIIYTLPFGSVRPIWGNTLYAYTKPAESLLGYVYKMANGRAEYVTSGDFGLMAVPYAHGIITTTVAGDGLSSVAHGRGASIPLSIEAFPEKCTPSRNTLLGELVCAKDLNVGSTQNAYPDDWYKGTISSNDLLWSISVRDQTATVIGDPVQETGGSIDVARILSNDTSTAFLLINKTDNSLWLFTPEVGEQE